MLSIVKVGLQTELRSIPPIPSAMPRTSVVFPDPKSPLKASTAPDLSVLANLTPKRWVSSAEVVVSGGLITLFLFFLLDKPEIDIGRELFMLRERFDKRIDPALF